MSDTKTRVDIAAIATAVAADLTLRFGHAVDPQMTDVSHKGDASYCTLDIEQKLGIFDMIVQHAEIRLRAEPCEDGTVWVPVDLRYSHVGGGSNGHSVGTYWLRDGIVEQYRPA